MKRYGPSRRCLQISSAALRIFVRHPKRDFFSNICQEQTWKALEKAAKVFQVSIVTLQTAHSKLAIW
jgi:hypothetical protein